MAIEAIGGTVDVPSDGNASITPPSGETWCITRIWAAMLHASDGPAQGLAKLRAAIGQVAGEQDGGVLGGFADADGSGFSSIPVSGSLIIDATHYLSLYARSNAVSVSYSGVKL